MFYNLSVNLFYHTNLRGPATKCSEYIYIYTALRMSICTATDVYSAASIIGQELQLLIDQYGSDAFEGLMYKVIHALEELEFCVNHSSDAEKLIEELKEKNDALKAERNKQNLQDFATDLDLMQQSWYNETQHLMDQIASLESDNQRLKCQLENAQAESTASTTEKETATVSELVTGRKDKETQSKRPLSLPIKPLEVDSLLAHTEERLQLTQQESLAGDLQLIRLLKSGIINLSREIKEVRQEILFLEASIDAAEEEVCRLARESGQLLAKSPQQMSYLSSEQTTLEEQLAACERKLEELSVEMGTTQKIESPREPDMPLHLGPCEGLESVATTNKGGSEEPDSLLALEQFRSLLYERNHLRARLMELRAGFEAISDKGEDELVYGPLPKEPFEKMYPQLARPKSVIKSIFLELLEKISDKTS
nr:RILP protein 1 [Hymenolepis microstoma]